ncbi:MAG: PDZ domain-containing protein, partial [Planctomycetota bacterium]|nr:PDZ domain-containing protein [Planctomycetota bacterium]
PVLSQGRVWILPQDSNELLAFDQQSGAPISLPRAVAKTGVVPWPEMKWLLGVVDDWMILGGVSSYVLRLSDFRAHSLASANTSGCGRGQIVGEDVYLSIQAGGKGALGLYAGLGSWRKIRTPDWKGEKQKGNLLLAGSTLVVSTDKIYFYTDAATVRRRFASRIKQSPPDLKSLLDYAALMDSGGIWKEAVEAYLEYDRMTKGTGPPSTTVRDRLHELFLKIGEDLDNSSLPSKLRYFQQARKFAPSPWKKAHMEWKMSELLYEMGRNREAIDLCRKMRDLYPDYIFSVRGGETSVRVREFASHLISKIQEKDPGAYRHVEIVAKQALKEVQEDRLRGWRKIGTLFPNSQAAKEARRLLLEEFLGQEEWEKALGLLRETSLPSDPRPIFQLLERLGDRERLVSALQDWRLQFGDTVLVTKGNTSPVHEIAGQWLQRIAENALPQKDLPDGALSQVGQTLEKEGILPLSPLHPQGLVPPMFPKEGALLQLGSSVELRDIHDGSRKWRVNHPFGYSGIRMQGKKGTFSVRSVDQDSPAARAGLVSGDLIEELNGVPTTSFLVSRFLRAGLPGSLVSMKVKRKESLLDISFTLGTIPPDKGAPVIGAAYTQGYSLAIVWPEVVVAVNVRSGVQEWIFTTEGGRFSIQGMKGGEGTLLLGGNEAGKSRLVCLEDRTGAVRWIRNYPLAQSVSQKVTLSSFYQDEAISVLQFSPSGKSVLRIFDRKTGEPLSKEVLFPQGILSHSVDEAAGVFHVLQGLSGRNRQLRGISLRGKTVGQDLYLITLSPNQIGTDVRGSQIFARDSHLVLMIPSGVQRRKSGVYVFDLRKKRFAYSISLPEDREWSKGMCEGVPIDLDGVLYLYSETMASEPGNRTGFVGAYVLGETPQLQWEAVAPTLPFSSSARWTLDTEMKNHLLFLTPDGGVPGEKGDRPVAALYSKIRGGYLEQVFSDLDDRLKGKVFSRSPGRLLFSTSVGVKGYGSP